MKNCALLTVLMTLQVAAGAELPRVTEDIQAYDRHVAQLAEAFRQIPANPADRTWVMAKRSYSDPERMDFSRRFLDSRLRAVDESNTSDLKDLLKTYYWFTISEFGADADNNAWLLVQHADHDREFQKGVLSILEPLVARHETDPQNFAYLFDRVAVNFRDPAHRELQRYGTQGQCTGPGTWEPFPVEDPDLLNARRRSVSLAPEDDYKKKFTAVCHESSEDAVRRTKEAAAAADGKGQRP